MKKIIAFIIFAGALTLLAGVTAYAAVDIKMDDNAAGVVNISVTDMDKEIGANLIKTVVTRTDKDGNKDQYSYSNVKSDLTVTLTAGNGDYLIQVLQMLDNGKGKVIGKATYTIDKIDEQAVFTASVPMADYDDSVEAKPAYQKMTADIKAYNDKITAVYENIIKTITYDNDKAAKFVASALKSYFPVMDDTYATEKGICMDYATMFAGTLRSMGIPVRVVLGYTPETTAYHAWNEIQIDGKWVAVDTTFDAAYLSAGKDFKMVKDESVRTIVKVY